MVLKRPITEIDLKYFLLKYRNKKDSYFSQSLKEKLRVFLDNLLIRNNTFCYEGELYMVKFSKLHFLIGIVASVLLVVQAVFGIMMYVNGGDIQEEMAGQRMMGQPTNNNTTDSATTDDSTTEDSTDSDTAATDDSTTATTPNGGQGNMGTPPQGGPNGSGTPGEMPSGGGFQGRDSLAGKVINFYQGVGGLATSIIVLVIGGAGLVTSVMSRKSAA